MTPVAEADILARLSALSISHHDVVEHERTDNVKDWKTALDQTSLKGKDFLFTKTLLFKPKQPKSAVPTPVLVVAQDTTETSSAAIGKLLNLKELRLAAEALVDEVLPGNMGKGSLSPFLLPPSLPSTLHILLDTTLTSSPSSIAVHTTAPTKTVLIPGTSLLAYVQSLQSESTPEDPSVLKNVQIREVDFASLVKDEVASRGNVAQAGVPKEAKQKIKNEGKKEDAYEMAIAYTKEGDFPRWYSDVLVKGDMLDYYDVSGCYILKPWSYTVWQHIQNWFDAEIKKIGVEDCYFPMFVSSARLEKEKDHIEGFAPEVAWVTKAGSKDLEEPIAIRPTSETVMYPYYAKWIRSHRDLPLKLNQWNSVVRWEFKNPQPFLRTREFLWQEGHTAFLTQKEAGDEVLTILDLYRRVYEDLLAVPVIPGVKSEGEKFAGGLYTTTVEGYIPTTGRGIQGGTSHCLGQNFSKMFDISVQDPNGEGKINVWQNSWGLSTRTIGVMVMIHGDDQGLVMPPRVSSVQVVIVPVGLSGKQTDADKQVIYDACKKVEQELIAIGVRAKADLREGYTPGWKFNDWELRGVPIRLEIGPRDLAAKEVKAIRRVDGHKFQIPDADLKSQIPATLEEIHHLMFNKAKKAYDDHIVKIEKFEEIVPALDAKNVLILPWCEIEACEDDIKKRSAEISAAGTAIDEKAPSAGAKTLCIPFDQERFGKIPEGRECVGCGKPAKRWTMFGRSY